MANRQLHGYDEVTIHEVNAETLPLALTEAALVTGTILESGRSPEFHVKQWWDEADGYCIMIWAMYSHSL